MANETYLTVSGRITADPELKFTPSGAAVANFTVAVNARKFDKNTNEWVEREAKFWRCQIWNQGKLTAAENVADTLKKGDAVVVYGEIETRSYETKEGEKRTVDQIKVEHVGKDLRFHGQSQRQPVSQAAQSGGWNAPTAWDNPGQQADNSTWGTPQDAPPF